MQKARKGDEKMNCHKCEEEFVTVTTDLPFKTGPHSVVIIKDLPVLQCTNCGEFLILDADMQRIDAMLASIERDVEVEIIRYAA